MQQHFMQLYFLGAVADTSATFGEGAGPVLLDNVACTGTEFKLLECANTDPGSYCSHSQDAGVICQAGML